jgi:hypothetical protein
MDFFDKGSIDLSKATCHSGGAEGADSFFEQISKEYGVKTNAYSYKTDYHKSENKVEISNEDYKQGVIEIHKANKTLKRYGFDRYINLLARNWAQVKYSKQIFAVSTIVKPGEKNGKGKKNSSNVEIVDGGTGWAIQMSINHNKEVFVFDQKKELWFRWSYVTNSFIQMKDSPIITEYNFAGIGTREINKVGINAIKELFKKSS